MSVFLPLEVSYDFEYATHPLYPREIAQGPPNMWRYRRFCLLPDSYVPQSPSGLTPLVKAPRLAQQFGAKNLYIKNDAVCMPTLSFKDRVVAVALANAQDFGFDTVGARRRGTWRMPWRRMPRDWG